MKIGGAIPWRRGRKSASSALFIVCALLWISPIVLAALSALRPPSEIRTSPGHLFGSEITIRSYQALLETPFGVWLANSLSVAFTSSALTVICALPLSYASVVGQSKLGRRVARLLLLTYLIPSTFLVFPILFGVTMLGLRGSSLTMALLSASLSVPFATWLLQTYIRLAPLQLFEAADQEGISMLPRVWHVMIPLLSPGVLVVAAFAFIIAWGEYTFSVGVLLHPNTYTASVGLPHFLQGDIWRWDYLLAAIPIVTAPALVCGVVALRVLAWLRGRWR